MPRLYSRQGTCSTQYLSPASHRFSYHPYRRDSINFDRGVMEETSVQRKEKLAAMRMEALEGGANSPMVSQTLANPLIEQPNLAPEPHAGSRFDYYTDPMAAFLLNKRGQKVSHQIPPDFTNHHPSPAHPGPTVQTTPNPGHFQAQGPYNNPGQIRSPAQQFNSSPALRPFQAQGPYYNPDQYSCPAQQLNSTPESRPFQAQGPYYNPGPFRSPAQHPNYPPGSSPFQAQGPHYDPRPFRSPAQQPNFPPGSIPFQGQGPYYDPRPLRSPAPQPNCPPGSIPFQGQGPYYNPGPFVSPAPMGTPDAYNRPPDAYNVPPGNVGHCGRPRGPSPNFVSNASPNHGQGGRPSFNHGHGRGFNPRNYCKKSMVEDPWEGLKPVLWKHSKSSWLPKSLSAKKPRVSEAPIKKESGPSLAEYLAASFHETTNETEDNDDDNDDMLNV